MGLGGTRSRDRCHCIHEPYAEAPVTDAPNIRQAKQRDLEEIAVVHREAVLAGYADIIPAHAPKPTLDELRSDWLGALADMQRAPPAATTQNPPTTATDHTAVPQRPQVGTTGQASRPAARRRAETDTAGDVPSCREYVWRRRSWRRRRRASWRDISRRRPSGGTAGARAMKGGIESAAVGASRPGQVVVIIVFVADPSAVSWQS